MGAKRYLNSAGGGMIIDRAAGRGVGGCLKYELSGRNGRLKITLAWATLRRELAGFRMRRSK